MTNHCALLFVPPILAGVWKILSNQLQEEPTPITRPFFVEPLCELTFEASPEDVGFVSPSIACGIVCALASFALLFLCRLIRRCKVKPDNTTLTSIGVQTLIGAEPSVIRNTGFYRLTRFGYAHRPGISPLEKECQTEVSGTILSKN
eukprot:Blabericola_migrator_1__1170@NODE_12_length_24658_cov_176_683258_g9_i0_p19_GENE_NODE_12_length_24658_cov_176_683258_g9_i0NODE_12_length_24658_cov_176_683258_g9_i0_p19_ORF_typecomplete_len147_score10_38DUF3159/PF11361_8/0_1MgtE/PF01769_16/0_18_NODE_12_length_24658_cov_176_683258_g9_i01230312743